VFTPCCRLESLPGSSAYLSQGPWVSVGLMWPIWVLLSLALLFALPAVADTIQQRTDALRGTEVPSVSDVPLFSGRLLSEFYAERDYRNAWNEAQALALLELARLSREDGFDPDDFHAEAIARSITSGQLQSASEAERTAADILFSDALLRYLHHFRFGKYNPRFVNPGSIFVDKADAEALKSDMEVALGAPDMAKKLPAMLPNPTFYRNLKRGYQRHLEIADRGGWQDIPGGPNLTPGMSDPRVPLIREHLTVTDGLRATAVTDAEQYDAELVEAIRGFQKRSGLAQDGVIGPNTLRALNHPLDDRLLTIRANLERMRWLYNDLPKDYLFVDVTAYRVYLLRNDEQVWSTPVVVGTLDAQTPMFRDEMEHIVFNPTWSVPISIQKKMRGVSSRYQVVDRRTGRRVSGVDTSNYKRYRIVQPAGPSNALGRVKFMFPNGHAIYLHDTPSKHLFARGVRTYSHGCIRVKDPLTLAQQLLNKPNWDQSAINRVVRRGKTRYVNLDEHLPVLLYYLTALADDQGRVGFRRDVYNRDKPLFAVLDRPAHTDRIAFVEPEPQPEAGPDNTPEVQQELQSKAERHSGDDGSSQKAGTATLDTAPNPRTPLPSVESKLSAAGPVQLPSAQFLKQEEGQPDSVASAEVWPLDLRPTLPKALTLNAEKRQESGAAAFLLRPNDIIGSGAAVGRTPPLLAPWPPEG